MSATTATTTFCNIVDRLSIDMEPEAIADILSSSFTDDSSHNDELCDLVQDHLNVLRALLEAKLDSKRN